MNEVKGGRTARRPPLIRSARPEGWHSTGTGALLSGSLCRPGAYRVRVAVYSVVYIWGRHDIARRRGRFFRQFCQQGLRLLEVGSIKALGEPAIDRREQGVGGLGLALL